MVVNETAGDKKKMRIKENPFNKDIKIMVLENEESVYLDTDLGSLDINPCLKTLSLTYFGSEKEIKIRIPKDVKLDFDYY